MVLKYSFDLFFFKCIFEFMINTAPDKVQTVWMAEKDNLTLLIFKVNLGSGRMAQWSVRNRTFFAGGSWGAGSNSGVATSSFRFLSSFFYPLAFYCLFLLLILLASRDFCENVLLANTKIVRPLKCLIFLNNEDSFSWNLEYPLLLEHGRRYAYC